MPHQWFTGVPRQPLGLDPVIESEAIASPLAELDRGCLALVGGLWPELLCKLVHEVNLLHLGLRLLGRHNLFRGSRAGLHPHVHTYRFILAA